MLKLLTPTRYCTHRVAPTIRSSLIRNDVVIFKSAKLEKPSSEIVSNLESVCIKLTWTSPCGYNSYTSSSKDKSLIRSNSVNSSMLTKTSTQPPAGSTHKSGRADESNPEGSDTKYSSVIALPLLDTPLFPGFYMPIQVKDPKLLKALEDSRNQEAPSVGAFLLKYDTEEDAEELKGKELLKRIHRVGTLAKVSRIRGEQVTLVGSKRLRITELVNEDPLTVKVQHLMDKPFDKEDDVIKATYDQLLSTAKDVFNTISLWEDEVHTYTNLMGGFNYHNLADFGAGISATYKHQRVLEELDVHKRLQLTLELVKRKVEMDEIHASIEESVEEKFSLLKEQFFEALEKELKAKKNKKSGKDSKGKSGKDSDDETEHQPEERFRKLIDMNKDKIPKHVLKVIEGELTKLMRYPSSSPDYSEICNYLDWLTALPWGNFSDENLDVIQAEKILNEDHFGLCDVKERILEFIAVRILRGTSHSQGKIICLCGPPRVGKTSIGRSIARALNRKFFLFAVGGVTDVNDIKGHCRTYRGAQPGKMVQCLKSLGTENPLVMIDEIDKIEKTHRGDPANALLEVLDPEQNANFLDHYLNVPIDLSKVLFVCTANVTNTIPRPLFDRLEVINLAGYITDEKFHIARNYLEKTACRDSGINPEQVEVTDAALLSLIENYCREAGVRNLQKKIEKIYRKIALKLLRQRVSTEATGNSTESETIEKVVVDEPNLEEYVGKPKFHGEKLYEQTPIGVVMGLAWTSMGGSTLYVEAALKGACKDWLHITGQLGDVMKESAELAHTVATKVLLKKEPKNEFFMNSKIHLHVPEGAIPKDGPSAGCTMITALLSLAMKKPVRKDLLMTGEVTLTGLILPIGGVKEKMIAARRSQVKMIILPEANRGDFDELAKNLKEGIDVHFVDKYDQIFELAF